MNDAVQDCPTDVVIPIVLIPGIMGSRLRQKANPSQKAWDPDDKAFTVWRYGVNHDGTATAMVLRAAWERKQLLVGQRRFASHDPEYLEPIDTFEQDGVDPAAVAERQRRGWGTVVQSFYGGTLGYLSTHFQSEVAGRVLLQNPEFNWIHSPVWGAGYNWTTSNSTSGRYAADTIRQAKAEGDQLAAENDATCPGILVVTHSMGGFVARSAVLEHGVAGDVLAVFHNVMPTDGAPAAYKRFHFGFENPDGGFLKHIEYVVLGRGGAWTNSTLGHSPGPQELLPNKRYAANNHTGRWMHIRNYDGSMFQSLPVNADPYSEIYQRRDQIYRCANPEWLYPEGASSMPSTIDPFDDFVVQNNAAKGYHDRIIGAGDYHDITYFSHSGDSHEIAWDHIEWVPEAFGSSLFNRSISRSDLSWDQGYEYETENIYIGTEEDKELEG
ncbi:MAG: hypothetical protein AAGK57_12855, partial [Pseudomonadota bacterium]